MSLTIAYDVQATEPIIDLTSGPSVRAVGRPFAVADFVRRARASDPGPEIPPPISPMPPGEVPTPIIPDPMPQPARPQPGPGPAEPDPFRPQPIPPQPGPAPTPMPA